jgi:hypothetical protein
MDLETVVAAAMIDDVIDKLDPIEPGAGAIIFEVELIVVLTIIERAAAARIGSRPSVMDVGVLHGDTRHLTAAGLKSNSVLRGIPALETVDGDVFGRRADRIDTGIPGRTAI